MVGTQGDFLGAKPEPTRSQTWFMMILLPVIAVGFGVSMVVTGLQHRAAVQPIPGGQTTPGVIVARHYVGAGGAYEPFVRFLDRTGNVQQFTGVSGDNDPVGTRVQVSYDPQDPARAHDLSQDPSVWGQLSLGIWVLVADAVIAVVLAVVIRRTKSKRRNRGVQAT